MGKCDKGFTRKVDGTECFGKMFWKLNECRECKVKSSCSRKYNKYKPLLPPESFISCLEKTNGKELKQMYKRYKNGKISREDFERMLRVRKWRW